MNKNIRFLFSTLLSVLIVVFCGVSLAEQKSMMESASENDLHTLSLCSVNDTAYILYGNYDINTSLQILSWTEGQSEPDVWAEGLIGYSAIPNMKNSSMKSKPSEDIIEHAVSRLFTDGERLLSFNPWNGKVFVITSIDGIAVFEDVITIKDTSPFLYTVHDYSYPHNCTGCALTDDKMIWTVTYWDDETQCNMQDTIISDLETGEVKISETVKNAAFSGNGKDGEIVMLLRDEENAYDSENNQWHPYIFVSYDPSLDTIKIISEIKAQYLSAVPIWSESLENYVFIDQNSHIYAIKQDGSLRQVGFYSGDIRVEETGVALVHYTVLIPGERFLLACSISNDFNSDLKLTTYQFNASDAKNLFNSNHPDVPVYQAGQYYTDYQMLLLALDNEEIDILSFSSSNSLYEALRDKNYLADLSGNAEIVALMENVWEPIREYCMKDGRIVAIPYYCSVNTNLWGVSQDSLKTIGMSLEDLPKDFISLCEFLTKWNDELIFEFPEIIPVLYEGEAVNKSNLIRMAVQYYIRYMVATGKDLTFDTPLFRKMAYALEKVKTDNIDAMLGNLDDEEVYDLSSLMEYGMPFRALWTNDAYTYLEIKPTQDSESIASVNLHMVAVNACSTNPELSAEFALDVLKTVVADNRFLIFADATDPLEDTGIKRSIEEIEEKIALVREMMKTSDNPEYAEMLSGWESELQDLQQHIWTVSPEEINYFRQDIAPHISIQTPNIFNDSDGNSSGEMWSLVQRWQDGQIDTEQFIRIADEKMNMIQLENH